jgi:hypothetical protein
VENWGQRFASWVDTLYKLTVFHHQDAIYKHEHSITNMAASLRQGRHAVY